MAVDDGECEALLTNPECDPLERKASLGKKERIGKAICSFANDLSGHGEAGVIFVGVREDGNCAGLPITDELLRELADLRSDGNLVPFPTTEVQKRRLRGCNERDVEHQLASLSTWSAPTRGK